MYGILVSGGTPTLSLNCHLHKRLQLGFASLQETYSAFQAFHEKCSLGREQSSLHWSLISLSPEVCSPLFVFVFSHFVVCVGECACGQLQANYLVSIV